MNRPRSEIRGDPPDTRADGFRKIHCLQDHGPGQSGLPWSSLSNVNYYGISEDFSGIQPLDVSAGRYLIESEFERGAPVVVIGNEVAVQIFGQPELAIDKEVTLRGKKVMVIGVIKKQGKQMIGGWDFDQSLLLPYRFARSMMNELRADPVIMVQGQDNLSSKALKDDLMGLCVRCINLTPGRMMTSR